MNVARRVCRHVWPIVVALVVVLPAIPGNWGHGAGNKLRDALLKLSIKPKWAMYAPNPERVASYLYVRAEYADGRTAELYESQRAAQSWSTHWFWTKTREDIWRKYAAYHPKRRSEHRLWYLRAVCVREARTGEVPRVIRARVVSRRLVAPTKVATGARGLGPPREQPAGAVYCAEPIVKAMIAADAARHKGAT